GGSPGRESGETGFERGDGAGRLTRNGEATSLFRRTWPEEEHAASAPRADRSRLSRRRAARPRAQPVRRPGPDVDEERPLSSDRRRLDGDRVPPWGDAAARGEPHAGPG